MVPKQSVRLSTIRQYVSVHQDSKGARMSRVSDLNVGWIKTAPPKRNVILDLSNVHLFALKTLVPQELSVRPIVIESTASAIHLFKEMVLFHVLSVSV